MKPRVPFALIAALGVVAAVVIIVSTKDHSGDELRRIGKPVADSLDAYTHTHQACPSSLAAIGLTAPDTRWGPFRYQLFEGGKKCSITAGVYARDGFEEYWMYPPGDWYSSR
jgi:hypothetical protein